VKRRISGLATPATVTAVRDGADVKVRIAAGDAEPREVDARLRRASTGDLLVETGGVVRCVRTSVFVAGRAEMVWVSRGGQGARLRREAVLPVREGSTGVYASELRAPMPGRVVKVLVAAGQTVGPAQPLVVVEAMKMEHVVRAPAAGRVQRLCVSEGDHVDGDALLVELAPPQVGAAGDP